MWDDEAGTVRGDHQYVSDLQQGFKDKLIAVGGAVTVLEDPAHNAREFLALIAAAATESSYLDPRSVLRVQLIPSTDIRGVGGSETVGWRRWFAVGTRCWLCLDCSCHEPSSSSRGHFYALLSSSYEP